MQHSSPTGTALSSYPTLQHPSANQHPVNLCNHPQLHVEGYPKLAYFFSRCTRYLHLRRFSAIAIRLLLYREHTLVELEQRLLGLEDRDIKNTDSNDPSRRLFCADFALLKAASPSNDRHEQRDLYETLKLEMKEYGKYRSENWIAACKLTVLRRSYHSVRSSWQ